MEETTLVDSREALWKERLADYEASGLSIKKWCNQNEISMSTFAYWRKKFKSFSYSKTSDNEMVFAKLPSKEEILREKRDASSILIHMGSIRIEIQENCSQSLLKNLFGALREND